MFKDIYIAYSKKWQLLCFVITLCVNCIAQQPEFVLPVGHTDKVTNVSFSRDGRYLITASNDHTAIIWETATGSLIKTLQGHSQAVTSAGFSSDGKQVVTTSYDHSIKIWDALTGNLLKTVQDPKDTFYSASFSPDGKQVVAFTTNTVQVWDAEQATLIHTIEDAGISLKAAAFSPDGKYIITIAWENIKIWDATTAALTHRLKVPGLAYAAYNADGSQLQVITNDASVTMWDITTEKQLRTIYKSKDPKSNAGHIIRCSNDGKYVAAALPDNTVKVWDATTGAVLPTLKGHTDMISALSFSPDGRHLATSSFDKTGRIWTTANGSSHILKGQTRPQWSASYSPDGKYILTPFSKDSCLGIWTVDGTLLHSFKETSDIILCASWSADSRYIATSSRDNSIKIWNVSTGKPVSTLKGHDNLVWNVAFSPDGKYLASVSNDKTAKIWDVTTGKLLQTLKGHTNWLNSVAWSPDSKSVVTTSWDGTIKIWTAATGTLVRSQDEHMNIMWDASFSPDGKQIITGDTWRTKVWEIETGVLVHTLEGGKTARYSADGKFIVTGADDNTAKIWDAATAGLLQTLEGHKAKVRTVSISSDGKHILTYSDDNTNKVWDVATGNNLFTFFATRSGEYLVTDPSGHYDGTSDAPRMLYLSCGLELISLDQVRDQLWVPHLAQRAINGESIKAKKVTELDVCDQIPEVEEVVDGKGGLYFRITPRRGGLGETVVYVNGIEMKRYFAAKLDKPDYYYELRISKEEFRDYLQAGKDNKITIRAFTVENDRSSRPVDVILPGPAAASSRPTLYAMVIGINDNKDTAHHLQYASKDAADISAIIKTNAAKTFGADHVFTYMVTAGDGHYMLPDKEGIRKTLEEISKKAKPNDVLVIYFAGHTAVEPSSGQLYLLMADASRPSMTDAIPGVDLSTQDLISWLHPAKMKAQKRILFLDARNSGQALGQDETGITNSDEKALQVKGLGKLNDRSGFQVLAAPATNKGAAEAVDAAIKKVTGK